MKRPIIRSLGLATAVLLLAQGAMMLAGEEEKKDEPFQRLTVAEVGKMMADPAVHIYDGNTDEVYLKGHVPGAVHLYSKDIKEGVLPDDKGSTLIFYCHNER
jgi:Rhodanese-like domain